MSNIHAALEIGTTRTVLAVTESESGGRPRVVCCADIASSGVRKSQILDINMATQSIRGVLKNLVQQQEGRDSDFTVGNVFLVVSGQHVKADPYQGNVQVAGSRVGEDDLAAVGDDARKLALPRDRELLDVVDRDYALDALGGIADPTGMSGRVLKLNTLHLHADRNRIENARTAAAGMHLEIREPLFAATCAAEAVLEQHEKRNGALVLDFGGGSTGYAVYLDGYLAAAGAIGVGGDHVTNDIAHAFQTTQAQAERLKTHAASAMLRPEDPAEPRVKIFGSSPLLESRTVSRRALDTVTNARLKELMEVLRDTLEQQDLLARLHAGAVLTGGGAAMRDLDELVRRELGTSVRIGRPIHVDGFEDDPFPASRAAIAGALMYAHRNYERRPLFKLPGFFGGLFK